MKRVCKICTNEFEATHGGQRCCSTLCRYENNLINARRWRAENPEQANRNNTARWRRWFNRNYAINREERRRRFAAWYARNRAKVLAQRQATKESQ